MKKYFIETLIGWYVMPYYVRKKWRKNMSLIVAKFVTKGDAIKFARLKNKEEK